MRTMLKSLTTIALVTLSACATVRGSQDSVPQLVPRTLLPISDAVTHYRRLTDERLRFAFRNDVLRSYQSAIEANYGAFTDQLNSGDRGSALGLDLLIMGLTGATALVGASSVNELATITAVASGTRSTIDRRLFFDRTLPALIASMDAERATIQADIARKRPLPTSQYSLDDAIDDLNRLQQAGRLDRALSRMTRVADADRVRQEARLSAIVGVCDEISPEATQLNLEFRLLVFGTDQTTRPARLRAAADELGVQIPEGTAPTWLPIAAAFDRLYCDDSRKREFIANFRARLQREAGGNNGGN